MGATVEVDCSIKYGHDAVSVLPLHTSLKSPGLEGIVGGFQVQDRS